MSHNPPWRRGNAVSGEIRRITCGRVAPFATPIATRRATIHPAVRRRAPETRL
jgi:hypothetical protein